MGVVLIIWDSSFLFFRLAFGLNRWWISNNGRSANSVSFPHLAAFPFSNAVWAYRRPSESPLPKIYDIPTMPPHAKP